MKYLDLPIFILNTTPGAPEGAPHWTEICHGQKGKDFLFIHHQPHRHTSRWHHVDAKRPFVVHKRNWLKVGQSSTLDGAVKIAKRYGKETD